MGRNQSALSTRQIEIAAFTWEMLGTPIALNTSRAKTASSQTGFDEASNTVYLGANAFPGDSAIDANSRLSLLACLAHELAHAERFAAGYRRPFRLPDLLLDEAETSIRASFMSPLGPRDREDLIEDARDRLDGWLKYLREA